MVGGRNEFNFVSVLFLTDQFNIKNIYIYIYINCSCIVYILESTWKILQTRHKKNTDVLENSRKLAMDKLDSEMIINDEGNNC